MWVWEGVSVLVGLVLTEAVDCRRRRSPSLCSTRRKLPLCPCEWRTRAPDLLPLPMAASSVGQGSPNRPRVRGKKSHAKRKTLLLSSAHRAILHGQLLLHDERGVTLPPWCHRCHVTPTPHRCREICSGTRTDSRATVDCQQPAPRIGCHLPFFHQNNPLNNSLYLCRHNYRSMHTV